MNRPILPEFAAEVMGDLSPEDAAELGEVLGELSLALLSARPSHALRTRILLDLDEAPQGAMFSQFADQVSRMYDIAKERAQALLNMISDPAAWVSDGTGVSMIHIPVGASLATADAGLVRMKPGAVFPRHRHLGDEIALVLQGAYRDSDGIIVRAGEGRPLPAGSWHEFEALPDEDCIFAAVVVDGIEFPNGTRLK